MKNWKDYATNADTGSGPTLPLPTEKLPSNDKKPSIPKAWLVVNIFLTTLCVVALISGCIATITTSQIKVDFSYFISSIAVTFIIPGLLVGWVLGMGNANPIGLGIISVFASIPLGIMLVINAVLAFHKFLRHTPGSQQNLLFAAIPPIFVIIILALLIANNFI